MPSNQVNKEELKCRILKLKDGLYNGTFGDRNGDWHNGAHHMLNDVLFILDEYRY